MWIAWFVVLGLWGIHSMVVDQDKPAQQEVVTATDVAYVDEQGVVRIRLRNGSQLAATAWKVTVGVVHIDGVERRRGRVVDGLAAFTGLEQRDNRFIPAGGTIEAVFPIPRAKTVPLASRNATVDWVIFEDRSAVGDRAGIEEAFRLRESERLAWTGVAAAMQAASAAQDSSTGLQVARQTLGRPNQVDVRHPVIRTMQQNVERISASPEKYEEFVNYWSARANRWVLELTRHGRAELQQPQ